MIRHAKLSIDNLDKAWDPKPDLERVSELIFGLRNVSGPITAELEREDRLGKGVNFKLYSVPSQ